MALGLFWGMGSDCSCCPIYAGFFQEKKVVLKGEMTMRPKTIIILILIVLFSIILIQNTEVVTLQLFFWKISMSRIIMISFLILLGFFIGFLVAKLTKKY